MIALVRHKIGFALKVKRIDLSGIGIRKLMKRLTRRFDQIGYCAKVFLTSPLKYRQLINYFKVKPIGICFFLCIILSQSCHLNIIHHQKKRNTASGKDSALVNRKSETPKIMSNPWQVGSVSNEAFPSNKKMEFLYEPDLKTGDSKKTRNDWFFSSNFVTTPKKDDFLVPSMKVEEKKTSSPKILSITRSPGLDVQELEPIEILTTSDATGQKDLQPVLMFVEEKATFQGGDLQKFQRYVLQNFKIWDLLQSNVFSGKIIAQFVVGTEGKIENIKILKGLNFGVDNELVRVLQSSPPWKPAKQGGKAVKQRFILPLTIDIKSEP